MVVKTLLDDSGLLLVDYKDKDKISNDNLPWKTSDQPGAEFP